MSYISRRSSRLATALQPRAAGPGLHGDDSHGVAAAGGRSGNLGLYDVSSDILYIYYTIYVLYMYSICTIRMYYICKIDLGCNCDPFFLIAG